MKGESRSGVSQEANSAALTVRGAGPRGARAAGAAASAGLRGWRRSFCRPQPPARGDGEQRQLGGEQRRRQQERAAAPGRCGRGRRGGCARASATCARGRRTRSRGRRPRPARSRARRRAAAAAARGRRPRGRGRSAPGSRRPRRQVAQRDRQAGAGERRRPRRPAGASAIGRPWPPAQTMPVKWTGLPAELISVPPAVGDQRLPGGPAAALAARAGGSPRRSRAAAPRRG